MKKVLFIIIWITLFTTVFVALNLYSGTLYSIFNEKEVTCNKLSNGDESNFPEECLIENILLLSERERTPIQQEVVKAYQTADRFSIIFLFCTVLSVVLSGVISWFVTIRSQS